MSSVLAKKKILATGERRVAEQARVSRVAASSGRVATVTVVTLRHTPPFTVYQQFPNCSVFSP